MDLYFLLIICLVVTSPEDVVHRYQKVLKQYKKTRSLARTCQVLGVDKNTIAGTAVIADVIIAGGEDGEFGELPPSGRSRLWLSMPSLQGLFG